jgi:hypothetical protein
VKDLLGDELVIGKPPLDNVIKSRKRKRTNEDDYKSQKCLEMCHVTSTTSTATPFLEDQYRKELVVSLPWWNRVKEWCKMFISGCRMKPILLLCGPSGSGKTFVVQQKVPESDWMSAHVITLDLEHPSENLKQQVISAVVRYPKRRLVFHLDYSNYVKETPESRDAWHSFTNYYLKSHNNVPPLIIECRNEELFAFQSGLSRWSDSPLVERVDDIYRWRYNQLQSLLFQYIKLFPLPCNLGKSLWSELLSFAHGDCRRLLNELDMRRIRNQWKSMEHKKGINYVLERSQNNSLGIIETMKLLYENYDQLKLSTLIHMLTTNPILEHIGYRLLDFSVYLYQVFAPSTKQVSLMKKKQKSTATINEQGYTNDRQTSTQKTTIMKQTIGYLKESELVFDSFVNSDDTSVVAMVELAESFEIYSDCISMIEQSHYEFNRNAHAELQGATCLAVLNRFETRSNRLEDYYEQMMDKDNKKKQNFYKLAASRISVCSSHLFTNLQQKEQKKRTKDLQNTRDNLITEVDITELA